MQLVHKTFLFKVDFKNNSSKFSISFRIKKVCADDSIIDQFKQLSDGNEDVNMAVADEYDKSYFSNLPLITPLENFVDVAQFNCSGHEAHTSEASLRLESHALLEFKASFVLSLSCVWSLFRLESHTSKASLSLKPISSRVSHASGAYFSLMRLKPSSSRASCVWSLMRLKPPCETQAYEASLHLEPHASEASFIWNLMRLESYAS
ncbi:hypothetical protein Fmac_017486 [Flemingia macrophylla]|uniref:Uncharacterized protein n=1 Tax=Flemingia macrophylla TaxID=520843 RepID=A0ABD1M2A6_9FABA